LDTTLLTWANLYHIYNDPNLDDVVHTQVLNSLLKRWLQMDQDIFISAVIMNPYIRVKFFAHGHPQLSPIGLYNITKCTFVRMFQSDPDLNFYNAFFDYLLDTKEFSHSLMGLADLKQLCKKEQSVNLMKLWERLDTSVSHGCNSLVHFAVHLLSIVTNSASCEQAFSEFGITHTKRRNHLSEEKVHKSTMVKMDL
ncbi:hypothetical protein SCLCIDRAFT_113723, partial [Scleroderma citrinum Foug A]